MQGMCAIKGRRCRYVWVAYSKAPPYLPVAIADTAKELAAVVGLKEKSVISSWYRYRRGEFKETRYHRIKIE